MTFKPFIGYAEVEPLTPGGPILSDSEEFVEKAKVVSYTNDFGQEGSLVKQGDIIFFRPHGFFELVEHDGKKHYVVRVHEEIILGVMEG